MNATELSIVLRAGYDVLNQNKDDLDYIQLVLDLLESELETPADTGREYQRTLMSLYRRLFRHYLKIDRQSNPDDAAFDLPEMRFESRLTKYLRQALMRMNDPKRTIKNPVVLTPEEVSALTTLRETSRRLREFEAQTQLYDFLETSTFSYKPIAALAKYMTNPRG